MNERKGIDVNSLVEFNEIFVNFQIYLSKVTYIYLEFFKELYEKLPDFIKLFNYGHKLMSVKSVTEGRFNELIEINNSHITNLRLYEGFLSLIYNEKEKAESLNEKRQAIIAREGKQDYSLATSLKKKYDINSPTCIFIISGNIREMGKVLKLNNDIKKLYEFENRELIGQNISKIMPDVYQEAHEAFLQNFFVEDRVERDFINRERVAYAITKKGYLVPSSLMIKILPEMSEDHLRIVRSSLSGNSPLTIL